ncbi:MAG: NAD-dependent epimerase/dehydratase family protein [Myxococcales bacterium]|nr:NAD-dependent epimerase/dehydratase family protein [Myxococcales bacterium]
MSRTVLITGGAGFIGCNVAQRLLAQGDEVVVFDNLHPQCHTGQGRPKDLPKDVQFIPGDVTLTSNWASLLKLHRPEVVLHLAAETGTGQSLTEANRHAMVNVSGTAQLVDAMTTAKHVPSHFVLTSSRAVYGDGAWRSASGEVFYPGGRTRAQLEARQWDAVGPDGRPALAIASVADVTHPSPISVYGATKLTQEHILATWCRAFGAGLSTLRLQNVYGPGQALGNPYTGVLTFFAQRAVAKQPLDVYEDGKIVRDFVFIHDVADALAAAASQTSNTVRTFDIGSGEPTTIEETARVMARLAGAPPPQVSGRFRDGDVRAASCSIEAATKVLGYRPKVSLEQGLTALLASIPRT